PARLSALSALVHEKSDRRPQSALALQAFQVSCKAVQSDRAMPTYRGYLAKKASGFAHRINAYRGPAMGDQRDAGKIQEMPVRAPLAMELLPEPATPSCRKTIPPRQ